MNDDIIIPHAHIYNALKDCLTISATWDWQPPASEGVNGWGRRVIVIEVRFAGRLVASCEVDEAPHRRGERLE